MKKITVFLLAVFCLGMLGCSKDAEIQAFMTENDAVVKEIVGKIDANPTEEGVDEAQKAFDAKKPGLKAKWDAIKGAVGMQVSADTKKKLTDSMTANGTALASASIKLGMDADARTKFQKLISDYIAMLDVPK